MLKIETAERVRPTVERVSPTADHVGHVGHRVEPIVQAADTRLSSLWRDDPVMLISFASLAIAMAVLTAWGSDPADLAGQTMFTLLALLPMDIAFGVLAYRVAQAFGNGHSARRFWLVLAGIGGASFLTDVALLVALLQNPGGATAGFPGSPVADGIGVAIHVAVIAVLVSFPLGLRSRRERACFWLDMSTVMVGALGFGGYAMFSPDHADVSGHGFASLMLGPVVHLVVGFTVLKLIMTGSVPFTRRAAMAGLAAVAFIAVVEGMAPALYAGGEARWYLVAVTIDSLAGIFIFRFQLWELKAHPEVLAPRKRRRPYSLLPYVAVVAVYGLLVYSLSQDGLDSRSWAVIAAAIGCTGLVIVRQIAAFAENHGLLGKLHANVNELNQAKALLQAALHEREELTEQLRHLAFHDPLTGLANRALFLDRAELATSRSRRENTSLVVMLVDLDDFKPINDRYGHAAGDVVLREVAERLRQSVREIDTVARLGGDEFAILLEDIDPLTIDFVTKRIIAAVEAPISLDGTEVHVGTSIGVAQDQTGEFAVDRIIQAADDAMYRAKRSGKGTYQTAGLSRAA